MKTAYIVRDGAIVKFEYPYDPIKIPNFIITQLKQLLDIVN